MRAIPAARRQLVPRAGALALALLLIAACSWRGGSPVPAALAATFGTPAPPATPCLVARDLPYYGGAIPGSARPPTSPATPSPAVPSPPADRYIPPRTPGQDPCQLRLLH